MLKDVYGEENASKCRRASPPPNMDWIFRLCKTCPIFALLTYKLLLTHYVTNNLYDLPYRSHTPGNDLAYSWCPFCGMVCNSWIRASIRFYTFPGWCGCCRIRLECMPQVCSIGLRYAELVSQFITLIHSSSRKVKDTRAGKARALYCINMNASTIAPASGLTIGSRI